MGFADDISHALASLHIPPWLVIAIVSLLPFIELRGGVLVALAFGWTLADAILFTAPISIIPGLVIVYYLDRLEPLIRRVKLFDRALDRAFAWTRKKHAKAEDQAKRDRRATILLALLVAIPGPGTGAWTGGLVSYVFEVPKRKAVGALILGVVGEAAAMAVLVIVYNIFL